MEYDDVSKVASDEQHNPVAATSPSDHPTVLGDDSGSLEPVSRPPLSSVPSMIDGRYVVERPLGEGTAGVVYLCRHIVIDKLVAIKVLRNDLAQDELVYDRFANEARAATAIGSEHIVETLDFGHTEDGNTYIVMEYLEGETLGALVRRERLLEFERVVRLMRQVTKGLAAAHDAGIVHRDVKPDNVFITQAAGRDFIQILDFGVAKMARAQGAQTRAGSIFGTPHYMSPEQAAGKSADLRADIYSVGVMLHELACAEVPFDAEAPLGILTQHMQDPPPRLGENMPEGRELPRGYEAIVLKCLSKEPDERYASMRELDSELEVLERGLAPQAVEEIAQRDRLASLHPPDAPGKSAAPYYVLAASVLLVGGAWVYLNSRGGDGFAGSQLAPPALSQALMEPAGDQTLASVEKQAGAKPEPRPEPEPSAEPVAGPAGTKVDLVLFPLNARVFKGEEDLGQMPVSVFVPEGESVSITVKHKGYVSRKVQLDGTESRVVLGLKHWTESAWGRRKLEADKRKKETHDRWEEITEQIKQE